MLRGKRIEEPLRAEVPEAIAICKQAGIKVIMLTGDSVTTATRIAQKCNMLSDPNGIVLDGPQFRRMDDDEVVRLLPNLCVLARATPLDKLRVVNCLKWDPMQVVAVTGDGTNDAPALKAADVGFAMNSGSDIAKRASDIVLLDDNFVGMVKATMWGRNVRDNIRKFLQFQLTVNLAACVVAFVGAVINSQNLSPLKPVQLLWLNLIMDTLAALALATELPSDGLLQKAPESKGTPIITRNMLISIGLQSSCQLVIQMFLLLFAHRSFEVQYFGDYHLTLVFNCFVLLQVFNFFNARLLHGESRLFENWNKSMVLLYIVLSIVVAQVLLVQKGGRFMSTVPLTVGAWIFCSVVGSVSLLIGFVVRYYQRSPDAIPGLRLLSILVAKYWKSTKALQSMV